MTRLATICLLGLLLTATPAVAAHGRGDGSHDWIKGEFGSGPADMPVEIAINARAEADGTQAGGSFSVTIRPPGGQALSYAGKITCLTTVTADAAVAGVVTASDTALVPVGSATAGVFRDQGTDPANRDQFVGAFDLVAAPICPVLPYPSWAIPVIREGNFTIHDALD